MTHWELIPSAFRNVSSFTTLRQIVLQLFELYQYHKIGDDGAEYLSKKITDRACQFNLSCKIFPG